MDFTNIGATVTILLAFIMNTQANDTTENLVFYHSILIVKQNNQSSLNEPLPNISMDIRKGKYPNISSEDERIKVGEPIAILIYFSDLHNRNIIVDECWAYNEENYNNSTVKLQLTNKFSDFQESFLTDELIKELELYPNNITKLLYRNLNSFKFPEKEYVYIACIVEICYGACNENLRHRQSPKLNRTTSDENQSLPTLEENIKFLFSKLRPPSSTIESNLVCTPKSKQLLCVLKPLPCTKNSNNPHCVTIKPPSNCHKNSQDPKCQIKPPTATCYPGSQDIHCQTNPSTDCYLGSQNPQCHTQSPLQCYPGSQEPHCIVNSTINCNPGSKDPQCNLSSPPNCYPGSENPLCNLSHLLCDLKCKLKTPPSCYPGSQNPQCTNSNPTNLLSPPNCYPGSQDIRCNSNAPLNCYPNCNSVVPSPFCYPGSQNVLCKLFSFKAQTYRENPLCTLNSSATNCLPQEILKSKREQPILCLFKTMDGKCQHTRKKRSKGAYYPTAPTLQKSSSKLTTSPNCSTNSLDPRCGSNIDTVLKSTTPSTTPEKYVLQLFNRRCAVETSTESSRLSYNPLLPANCYPGSKDPRCTKPTSEESEVDQTTHNVKPPNCYPGSKDPRCSKY